MELKLVPKLQQSLVMTPQLKMAIKLLTLNHLELKDAVAQELIDNPVLEELPDEGGKSSGEKDGETPQRAESEKPAEVTLGADAAKKTDDGSNIDWESYAEPSGLGPAMEVEWRLTPSVVRFSRRSHGDQTAEDRQQ